LAFLPPKLGFCEVLSTLVYPLDFPSLYPSWAWFWMQIQEFQRILVCMPCDLHNDLWLSELSNSAHSLWHKSFNHPLGREKSNTFISLHTPCTTLCYTCTSMGIRETTSLLIFLRYNSKLVNALLVDFHCTPWGNSQQEKQLKLILPLSWTSYIQHEITDT